MATVRLESRAALPVAPVPILPEDSEGEEIGPDQWFDRSSITADVMVTLEGVSEEDWWKNAPEGRVCEYLDGVVFMPSPASREHQEDVGLWHTLLNCFLEGRGIGTPLLGPGVLNLAPRRNPEPDLFVVPLGAGPHVPPALLVIETLSKSTRSHDLGRKRDAFHEARIPEIVYVDLKRRRLVTDRLVEDIYASEVVHRGVWRSASIAGFWIDVAWLWEDPLSGPMRCLQAILAGPPA